MKHLSLLRKTACACGLIVSAALVSSCSSGTLAPTKAAQRLSNSPTVIVYSHNDMNNPDWRDCYGVGPLPDRAERALISWLHNSTVKEFSYVYPQYYITTTNAKGDGEVVWALCSDGRGNLVGVLVPSSKYTPAWNLSNIGGYKLLVCDGPEREELSTAIMESLADAGYDRIRIDTRKAAGVEDKEYLISKPLSAIEREQAENERRAKAKAEAAAKKKAAAEAAATYGKSDDSSDSSDDVADESDVDDSDDLSSGSDDSSSDDSDSSSSSLDNDSDSYDEISFDLGDDE